MCLYRPNARWEWEFEWLKTFQGPQLENSRKYLSLGVRKPYKNCQTEPTSPHVIWEVSRKIILAHPKTNSSIFSYQTWLELQMGLASMVRWNEKKMIFSSKHSRWVQWPFLWPEPCRKWVRWTEEKKHCQGAGNLKGLEWFWMKEWSLISCQVFSNLIRHYRRTFRAVKLANGGFKKYWIKGCC